MAFHLTKLGSSQGWEAVWVRVNEKATPEPWPGGEEGKTGWTARVMWPLGRRRAGEDSEQIERGYKDK